MARATFSLDESTIAEIKRTAQRMRKPQSHVIRDAVADYAARADRLSERERQERLGVLERIGAAGRTRSAVDVDAELRALRRSSKSAGRRHLAT